MCGIKSLTRVLFSILLSIVLTSTVITPALTVYASNSDVEWDELLTVPDDAEDEPNPEGKMAHNIYSDPVLDETTGKFNGFIIDFKADRAPVATYWSLCNWEMNTDDLSSRYKYVNPDGGAYAGMQMRHDGSKAIMAFWQILYGSSKSDYSILNAKRVYPSGDDSYFDGEGEGSNYICDYDWTEGKWYRMYLSSWDDADGKTYVEQWINDLSINRWTLISRFDTNLYHSCFIGEMSQFMENFDGDYANFTRSFQYRNINVREADTNEWKPVTTTNLLVDTWYGNKKGGAVFGATADFVYGITNGYGEDAFEPNEEATGKYTLYPHMNVDVPSCNDHEFNSYVANGDGTHYVICSKCYCMQEGVDNQKCSGGTADCESRAICSLCNHEYGNIGSHSYKTSYSKASFSNVGDITTACVNCGDELSYEVIPEIDTVKLSSKTYEYNGKTRRPTVTAYDLDGNKISSSNYTVKYPTSSYKVGSYSVKVVFNSKYYSGSKTLNYTINPAKTGISSIAARKKGFKVNWKKKTTQVTGYQVQYSRSSSFSKNNKTITIGSNKTVYRIVKNLTAGKRYYVRVRTYKVVNNKRYYSGWSSKKSVVTKKK